MHLVEIFLPLADNEGSPFRRPIFDSLEKELADVLAGRLRILGRRRVVFGNKAARTRSEMT